MSLYLVYTDSETGCTVLKAVFFFPVMQALYFCAPFREQLLEYYANSKNIGDAEENLLTCLADLFTQVIIITPWIVFESYLC